MKYTYQVPVARAYRLICINQFIRVDSKRVNRVIGVMHMNDINYVGLFIPILANFVSDFRKVSF
jgi:hypothetical protein